MYYILKYKGSKYSTNRFVDLSALYVPSKMLVSQSEATKFPDYDLASVFAGLLFNLCHIGSSVYMVKRGSFGSPRVSPINSNLPDCDTMYTFKRLGLRVFLDIFITDHSVYQFRVLYHSEVMFVPLFSITMPNMSLIDVICDYFSPFCKILSHYDTIAALQQAVFDFDFCEELCVPQKRSRSRDLPVERREPLEPF